MELPTGHPEGTILPPPPRPPKPIEDSRQPHCREHRQFLSSCPVCRQASANAQPYPVRSSPNPSRSFGYTDDLTEAKLKGPSLTAGNAFRTDEDPAFSLSLAIIRFILRLIWPFGRIL